MTLALTRALPPFEGFRLSADAAVPSLPQPLLPPCPVASLDTPSDPPQVTPPRPAAANPCPPACPAVQPPPRHNRDAPRDVQALLQALRYMPQLTALTLQFRCRARNLAPLCAAVATAPVLRHLSLLLHPSAAADDGDRFSAAFAAAWPALTSLSALHSLSLPFLQVAAPAHVFRSTHRRLTAFHDLQTLHLPFVSLTQPDVWLHVAQLSGLTALRLGGFVGPSGSMPDVWLQAVATAVCACAQLRRLEAENMVDEVLPWLGARLSQLGALQDLRLMSSPGVRLTVSAVAAALPALPELTRLQLGSQALHGTTPLVGFASMLRQRSQTAALFAELGALTGLQVLCLWGVLSALSGAEEAGVLGASLQRLQRLTRLDVSHNALPTTAWRALAPHLAELQRLRVLAARACGVDDDSMLVLAGAVMSLRELQRLDVRENFVGHRGASLLLAAVVELPLEDGVQI